MHRLLILVLFSMLMPRDLWAENDRDGRETYLRSCAHCHGQEGEGWAEKNGPTLRQVDWVVGDPDRLIRILLDGLYLRIPLRNGTHYGAMPGFRKSLSDSEIAGVSTYIRNAWGNSGSGVSEARVAALRAGEKPRGRAWTAAEFGLTARPKLGERGEALEPADPVAAAGFKLYALTCQNCHQADGRGIITPDGHGYPPLRDSEFVTGSPDRLIRIVLGGLQGEVLVGNRVFREVMPPWHAAMTDEQVAQVLTFIRQAWTNLAPPIRAQQVGRLRSEAEARAGVPWSAQELETVDSVGLPGTK